MSPRRPRRRARRRSPARPAIMLVAAVVVLALLVGGLTQVSRQSQGYDANSNRSLAAQGAVVASQSDATASQVRRLVGNLQAQTRQSIGTGLDSAVQQTANQAARMDLAAGSSAVRIAGRRARDRLHRPGPIRGRAAERDRRVPRDATHPDRGCPGDDVTISPVHHESCAGADREPGDEPNRRGRGAADAFGRPLPVGAKDARCDGRTCQAPQVGLGDRRGAVAGGHGRDPDRPHGHVADPGGEPLPPPAHGPPGPTGAADAAGRAGHRVGPQPHIAHRRDHGARQRRHRRRAARRRPLHAGETRPRGPRQPRSSRPPSPSVPRSRSRPRPSASSPGRPTCSRSPWSCRRARPRRPARCSSRHCRWRRPPEPEEAGGRSGTCRPRSHAGHRIGRHRNQKAEGSSRGREHHDHGQSQWRVH